MLGIFLFHFVFWRILFCCQLFALFEENFLGFNSR